MSKRHLISSLWKKSFPLKREKKKWKYNAIIKLSRPLSVVSEYGCNSVKLLLGTECQNFTSTHIVFILHHLSSSVYDSPKAYGQKFCNLAHWLAIVENIKMEIRPSFMSEHSSTINRFNIEIPLGLSPRPPLVARNTFFYSPAGWRVVWNQNHQVQLVAKWVEHQKAPCHWFGHLQSAGVTCSLHGRQQLLCKVYYKLELEIAHLQSKICVLVLQPTCFKRFYFEGKQFLFPVCILCVHGLAQ